MLSILLRTLLAALTSAGVPVEVQSADSLAYTAYKGYPIVMRYQNGSLEHIGVDIFGYGGNSAQEQVLLDFVERYNLQMLMLDKDADRQLQMDLDGVDAPAFFSTPLHRDGPILLNVSQTDGNRYTARWGQEGGIIRQMTFPSDYQFLTGKNKIELEDGFLASLQGPVRNPNPENPDELPLQRMGPARYQCPEGQYLIPEIHRTTYYAGEKGHLYPVISDAYPEESIFNVLILPGMAQGWTAHVRVLKYGYATETAEIPLEQLLGRCRMNGCIPYVGIESLDKKSGRLIATLMLHNEALAYDHVAKITLNRDQFSDETTAPSLSMTISVYVPIHNIKNLYK